MRQKRQTGIRTELFESVLTQKGDHLEASEFSNDCFDRDGAASFVLVLEFTIIFCVDSRLELSRRVFLGRRREEESEHHGRCWRTLVIAQC